MWDDSDITTNMENLPVSKSSKGKLILADLYSRENCINGKYTLCQIEGLSDLEKSRHDDIFYLETLKVRADTADKIIEEAKSRGMDVNDRNVLLELGKQINAFGQPIHRSNAIITAISVSLQLIIFCGIVSGIWGLVFKQSFLTFFFYGNALGLLLSFFVAPVISHQRTEKRKGDIVFGVSALFIPPIIWIGITGIIALVIRLIFFR
jgi:hypothetical protein